MIVYSAAISFARKFKERNGSIAGELLKRFNIIFDYGNTKITLKRNKNFKSPFHYNMSGIVIEQDGVRVVKELDNTIASGSYGRNVEGTKTISVTESYKFMLKPAFKIVELRKDSPAELAGLLIGDVILKINGKEAHHLKMQNINEMLRANEGQIIKLKVDRDGKVLDFDFKLKSLL